MTTNPWEKRKRYLKSLAEFDIDFVTFGLAAYIRMLIMRPILIEWIVKARLRDPFIKKTVEDPMVDTLYDHPTAWTIGDDNGL